MIFRNAWLALVLSLGLAAPAHARKSEVPLEGYQLLTGSIQVDAQGAVTGFSVDQRKKLSPNVLAFLDATLPSWRFQPVLVGGQPAAASSNMSMRLVLKPIEGDPAHYEMIIKGVHFNVDKQPEGSLAKPLRLPPPAYPAEAGRVLGSAEVYLVVKVGRDGKVADAMAEQVNLLSYSKGANAAALRKMFEDACVRQALTEWTFAPPAVGDAADDEYWTVRVPVVFSIGQERKLKGGWTAYDPGPRRQATWATPEDPMGFSPDALPNTGTHAAGSSGLQLLSMGGSH